MPHKHWPASLPPFTRKGKPPISYTHQGPAHVTVSARYFGADPVDTLNEAVSIILAGSGAPNVARLEFTRPLIGPERANYVRVLLPNGLAFAGPIVQGDRQPDGSGWMTFHVEDTDLGLA